MELCRQLHPDLVLMDVRMPEMDGLSATRAIKEELPAISVLLVTANEGDDYWREGASAGAAGYILKDALGSSCSRRCAKRLAKVAKGRPSYLLRSR